MSLLQELEEQGIDSSEVKAAAIKEFERRKRAAYLLSDPYLFYINVICPPKFRHLVAEIHREMLDFFQGGLLKKLMLIPRKHLKTSVITQGETLRRALINPNIRIQINTAVSGNAQRFLGAIRGHLSSPRFIEIFGDLLPPGNDKLYKNNASELTLNSRTDWTLREPTFTASGVGEAHTSQHYDLIVHDDLMNRDNVTNIDQIEKVVLHVKDSLDLLENLGEMWIIGTRWHPLDVSGWLLETHVDPLCGANDHIHVSNNCHCIYDVMIREVKEHGKYIWPELFNDKYMEEMLIGKDRYEVACQYYNNPIDPSACWFATTDIKASEIDPSEIAKIRGDLVWYIAVDPAESIKARSSYTAAVAVGIDFATTPATWYVDYAIRNKVETAGFIDLCMQTYMRYPECAEFGMELNTRKALGYTLKDRMVDMGILFNIRELKPSDVKGKSSGFTKELRIKRLMPLFEFKRIRINNTMKDLLDELYTLPSARSWDITDALSYIMSMVPEGAGGVKNFGNDELPTRVIAFPACGL
jgi:hypothetical protein